MSENENESVLGSSIVDELPRKKMGKVAKDQWGNEDYY